MNSGIEFGFVEEPLTGNLYAYYESTLIAPGSPLLIVTEIDESIFETENGLLIETEG